MTFILTQTTFDVPRKEHVNKLFGFQLLLKKTAVGQACELNYLSHVSRGKNYASAL